MSRDGDGAGVIQREAALAVVSVQGGFGLGARLPKLSPFDEFERIFPEFAEHGVACDGFCFAGEDGINQAS